MGITNPVASIYPGLVAGRKYTADFGGEAVTVANGTYNGTVGATRAFGLFANFVGGDLDELGTEDSVGVWRGVGGVFEVLAPAFTSTGLATSAIADTGAAANEAYLDADTNGLLALDTASHGPTGSSLATPANRAVARLLDSISANAIIVELLV